MINTILVVDNCELMRTYLADALTISNYETYSASNGKEALQILNLFEVDLIITELIMPVMEGIELIIALKRKLKLPVKIIAMTDSKRVDYLNIARELGADSILTKHFNVNILLEAIGNL